MAMNFLEELVTEWYEYQGYFIRRNVLVGKRLAGGHECELDVVAFHPETRHLVHIEPSMDASKWETRERRFRKKFSAGITYIPKLFPGLLCGEEQIEQIALLVFSPKSGGLTLGGGKVLHVSDLLRQIVLHFSGFSMIKAQVHEQFPLLRTIQFTTQYRRELFNSKT
jgi:hypothetical protein